MDMGIWGGERVDVETQGGSRHHGERLVLNHWPHITPAGVALVSPCWPLLREGEGWWVWGVEVLLSGMSRSWGVWILYMAHPRVGLWVDGSLVG